MLLLMMVFLPSFLSLFRLPLVCLPKARRAGDVDQSVNDLEMMSALFIHSLIRGQNDQGMEDEEEDSGIPKELWLMLMLINMIVGKIFAHDDESTLFILDIFA